METINNTTTTSGLDAVGSTDDGYTLIYSRYLTNLDRKNNPTKGNCVHAILKLDEEISAKPYKLVWFYDRETGRYESADYYETVDDAIVSLNTHYDCICPIKVLAKSNNTACDFRDCAWYVNADSACAFTAQVQLFGRDWFEMLEQISDRLANIDDTLMCGLA